MQYAVTMRPKQPKAQADTKLHSIIALQNISMHILALIPVRKFELICPKALNRSTSNRFEIGKPSRKLN